ncbi:MAG: nickel transporter [Methylophilaceae bacterium]
MQASQETLFPLIALAIVLGLKHGMDADHLASIDGLTRYNASAERPHLARLCGFLFSLGHGTVVCVVAVTASLLFKQAAMPIWLDNVGAWVSTFFLLLLGALNLYAVFSTPSHEMVSPLGLKGRILGRFNHAGHPALVALVGALFAISFDTLSQAALFSAASIHFGGAIYALVLAFCFMLGMMVTDAANGLWISHLLRRADATARAASRIMGLTVAMLSLGVAALGLSRRYVPEAAAWQEGRELMIGTIVIAIVGASFLFARYLPRRSSY